MTDLYEVLGVPRSASADEIRTAFRHLAKTMHPDVGGGTAEVQEVSAAYEVLSDPDKRARYDAGDHGNPADNERALALAIVHGAMAQTITQFMQQPHEQIYNDVVDACRVAIAHSVTQLDEDVMRMDGDIAKLKRYAARFKRKSGDNLLRPMVEEQVRRIEGMKKQADGVRKRHVIALELLDGHTFEPDPKPAPNQIFGATTMTSGFGMWPGNMGQFHP